MKRLAFVILLLLAAVMFFPQGCLLLERAFGPPSLELEEYYSAQTVGKTFDHGLFDRVLRESVTEDGWVDYVELNSEQSDLDAYLDSLAQADFESLSRDEKLALLINAYNAFTLRLILDHWPLDSIRDIPSANRWAAKRWKIGKLSVSLQDLENDLLRARFREPRIHFAINCASVGCPPLRAEAYRGEVIESQLQDQCELVHEEGRWLQLDQARGVLRLTRIYLWYENDFEQVAGSNLDFASRFSPPLAKRLTANDAPVIAWLEYDWRLNSANSESPK